MADIYIKKADGGLEPFNPTKLVESLEHVGTDPGMIQAIVKHITTEIRDGMTTGEIYHHAFELLRRDSQPIAMKYSLRRALSELGPNGFPFERYIGALMETQGYKTAVDQVVQGNCVSHEMDVVAWKDASTNNGKDELIMIEAKFHNEFGLRSDVKVALYVKARFDDLRNGTFHFGGKDRKMTKGILITNTKFTDQAIKYGECSGLSMIGWNYPAEGNLHDLIERAKLHPFTCLATLSTTDKKHLLDKGVILCREISANPKMLLDIGMDDVKSKNVIQEVGEVCGI